MPSDRIVDIEVIVAGNLSDETAAALNRLYPGVRLLRADKPLPVPQLRSWGIREARGDIVALLEDHCAPGPSWYQTILSGHAMNQQVLGGAIENASTGRLVDWAVYLFEYSPYMNPVPRGVVRQLPGNNVSYSRSALQAFESLLNQNLWESFWHRQLSSSKIDLVSNPDMIVFHRKSFSVQQFCYLARAHGHNHAASRSLESAGKKCLRTMIAAGLPAVIVLRIGRCVLRKGRHLKQYMLAVPFIFLFSLAWAFGEITGNFTKRFVLETGWGKGIL